LFLLPFLNIGVTQESFHLSRKTDVDKDLLKGEKKDAQKRVHSSSE
jgi:hypothetical protein